MLPTELLNFPEMHTSLVTISVAQLTLGTISWVTQLVWHNQPGNNLPGHNEPGHNEPGHNEPVTDKTVRRRMLLLEIRI